MKRYATSAVVAALLFIPLITELAGFRSARLLSQPIWGEIGLHHLGRYLLLFVAFSLPIVVFVRRFLVSAFIAAIVIGSVYAVGPITTGSVLLFVFSATVVGKLVFGSVIEDRLAFMAGLALWILAMTVTARLPVHYQVTYLVLLVVPIFLGYREAGRLASEWLTLFRPRPISWPEALSFLLLAFILVSHWLIVLKPEASTDGLATHLAIPFDMARFHLFRFDFRHYVWALMPLGTDLIYTVLYILGGEYAARLINFAMLTAIAVLLYREARRFASKAVSILVSAVWLSTPLTQLVTGSLFVENFVAAMCLAAVVALWGYRETRTVPYCLLTALLLATAVSLKLAAFAVVLIALPFFIASIPKVRLAIATVAGILAIASIPYATAWWRSGNPIYPYANNIFHSPYVGNDLVDVRFHPALSWRTPVRLTIDTHEYFEGQDGTFGFQYLLLLPLTLACVVLTRSFVARTAAAIGVSGAFIIAATQPNARYFYPVLPFLTIGAAAALAWLSTKHQWFFRVSLVATIAAAVANFYFLPASNWHHQEFYTSPLLRASGRQEYIDNAAPVRSVVAYLNRTAPNEPVFYSDSSQIAGLLAPAYRAVWHDYAFLKQVESCRTALEFYHLLAGLGVRHIIIDHYVTDRAPQVAPIIATCTDPEYRLGNFSALRLRSDCEQRLAGNLH